MNDPEHVGKSGVLEMVVRRAQRLANGGDKPPYRLGVSEEDFDGLKRQLTALAEAFYEPLLSLEPVRPIVLQAPCGSVEVYPIRACTESVAAGPLRGG